MKRATIRPPLATVTNYQNSSARHAQLSPNHQSHSLPVHGLTAYRQEKGMGPQPLFLKPAAMPLIVRWMP